MRALKYEQVGAVEVGNAPEPVAGPGEVVISVAFSGICGSDVHGIRPGGYRVPPLIMGHEFSGVTPDGRRVTVNGIVSCGRCDRCAVGLENVCRNRQIIGIQRAGGLAERVAVPEANVVELPAGGSLEAGALVEPLGVALRGWRRSRATAGSRVAIVGAGNIGLLLLWLALREKADVTITDTDPRRTDIARRMGATVTELDGQYDVTFDAVGATAVHTATVEHLRPGGTAIWIGSRSPDPAFDALDLVRSEKSVVASFTYTRADFRDAAALSATLDPIWIQVCSLEESADVLMAMAGGNTEIVKAVVRP